MPRRKRRGPHNEGRRKVRRTENDEETLVISDSENEDDVTTQDEDCVVKVSTREFRWRERENRTHMQNMTEEEMLDLAMRLSAQEAKSDAQRQQLEDNDIQAAIAESLHQVSQSQTPEAISTAKHDNDPGTVTLPLRCKLFHPHKTGKNEESADSVSATELSGVASSPLPPMPDLSQATSSQPSPSPLTPAVPSPDCPGCHCSPQKDQDEQVVNADCLQVKSSENDTPAALQQSSVRLSQEPLNLVRVSDHSSRTQDVSLSLTCPVSSQLSTQQSPSPPKSPVFAKTDPKGSAELSKDEVNSCTHKAHFRDNVFTPQEARESVSHKKLHKNLDAFKHFSPSRNAEPSSPVSVCNEEEVILEQEPLQRKPLKKESTLKVVRSPGLGAAENASKSELSSLATQSLEEYSSHMVLHLSDDDNNDDDDDELEEMAVIRSPVFQRESVTHASHPELSLAQHSCSPPMPSVSSTHMPKEPDSQNEPVQRKVTSKTPYPTDAELQETLKKQESCSCSSRPTSPAEMKSKGFVSYYWGVPFCPRGQNPDDYTRIILGQFEVFEKSLKDAQRQLLHKADWGLPALPCQSPRPFRRSLKRHRPPQLLEEEEENEDPDEESGKEKRSSEEDKEEGMDSQRSLQVGVENGKNETYVMVSSPETQEELVEKSPLMFGQQKSPDAIKPSSCRKACPLDPSEDSETQLPTEHEEALEIDHYDMERTICPETQMTEDDTPEMMVTSPAQPQSGADSEVMEVDEESAMAPAEEDGMEQEQEEEEQRRKSVPLLSQRVECPMCSRLFPLSRVELHAAYCDGATEDPETQDNVSQACRKRTRKISTEAASSGTDGRSDQQEKCHLCQKCFPLREYKQHVDQCLQRKAGRSRNQGNGLLFALDQMEKVDVDDDDDKDEAGTSDITFKNNRGLAECSVTCGSGAHRDSPTSTFHISSPNSPFKSSWQPPTRTDQRLGRKRKFKR